MNCQKLPLVCLTCLFYQPGSSSYILSLTTIPDCQLQGRPLVHTWVKGWKHLPVKQKCSSITTWNFNVQKVLGSPTSLITSRPALLVPGRTMSSTYLPRKMFQGLVVMLFSQVYHFFKVSYSLTYIARQMYQGLIVASVCNMGTGIPEESNTQ